MAAPEWGRATGLPYAPERTESDASAQIHPHTCFLDVIRTRTRSSAQLANRLDAAGEAHSREPTPPRSAAQRAQPTGLMAAGGAVSPAAELPAIPYKYSPGFGPTNALFCRRQCLISADPDVCFRCLDRASKRAARRAKGCLRVLVADRPRGTRVRTSCRCYQEQPDGAARGADRRDRLGRHFSGEVIQPANRMLARSRGAIGMVVEDQRLAAGA